MCIVHTWLLGVSSIFLAEHQQIPLYIKYILDLFLQGSMGQKKNKTQKSLLQILQNKTSFTQEPGVRLVSVYLG